MMTPIEGYTPDIDDTDEPTTKKVSTGFSLENFSTRQKVGAGLVGIGIIWWLATGSGGGQVTGVTNAFNPKLSEQAIAQSEDPNQASFYLKAAQLQSGLIQAQAEQFLGFAVQYQNTPNHYCNGKVLSTCLRSFQQARESEMMALYLDESSLGTKDLYSRVGTLNFEILSIEVAIAQLDKQPDAATQSFLNTVIQFPEIKTPQVASYIEAAKAHRHQQQMMEATEREKLSSQASTQKTDECTPGEPCF
jgi:hypothetical protein